MDRIIGQSRLKCNPVKYILACLASWQITRRLRRFAMGLVASRLFRNLAEGKRARLILLVLAAVSGIATVLMANYCLELFLVTLVAEIVFLWNDWRECVAARA
jgi:hypothetical protein